MRKRLVERGHGAEPGFRWRGLEVSRIEAFSDAVLAFAVALLVVSLEVPHTFADLKRLMLGFPAFGLCFALLILIWHAHYVFFRRYALTDTVTVALNAALLFVILFYIYPLKFLFTRLLGRIMGLEAHSSAGRGADLTDSSTLMVIYSSGFLAVFLAFTLLYLHAFRRRKDLDLDPLEILETRISIQYHLIFAATALLSIALAALGGAALAGWAGWIYWLIGPACWLNGSLMGRRRSALKKGAKP